jgi:hypothetical protein
MSNKFENDMKLLSDDEKKDLDSRIGECKWHPTERCPKCGGRMFWFDTWNKWTCISWLYMEGGC